MMKLSEEEIFVYLGKKAQRKAVKVAKKLKESGDYYSNESNPFGDSNLTERFIWRKKIERDVINQSVCLEMFSVKAEKKRQREMMVEFEKAKKRREERAFEKARHQEEKELLDRERAHAEFQDWEKKEAEFEFEQSKVRSAIRLRQGRVKPIDILCKRINGVDGFDIEISEPCPCTVFKGLTVKEMEDLRDDVKLYQDLDRVNPTHVKYWEAGSVSPKQIHGYKNGEVTDPVEDSTKQEQQKWIQEAMGAMGEGDAVFGSGSEVDLDLQVKDRLRKPKYFNRVHTGYEWNKYNRTHYDHDNPPPKFVQGYKFNIFYPDLVDKTKTPTCTVDIDKDGSSNGETCIIRFNAGSPYEDIAFRIVNKEWEYSRKKGFKCTFERGTLQLYFNFKRYRYRR